MGGGELVAGFPPCALLLEVECWVGVGVGAGFFWVGWDGGLVFCRLARSPCWWVYFLVWWFASCSGVREG